MERQARQTRPQLVCIVADNSSSMQGPKAAAATQGIHEMILECKARGPKGEDKSYFKILLVTFSVDAKIYEGYDMIPVRKISDAQLKRLEIRGDGEYTNITGALQLVLNRLRPYMEQLQQHSERKQHPLPLVILFSDGEHNVGEPPQRVASEIRNLCLDGEPVVIAVAGVSVGEDRPDEATLKQIASQGCYAHITKAEDLKKFISTVGSSGMSKAKDISDLINQK